MLSGYWARYFTRMRDIMGRIREHSAQGIAEAAAAAAAAVERGNTVYINLVVGHIPGTETANDRRGNPAPGWGERWQQTASDWWPVETYDGMVEGDVLITNHANASVGEARARGVFVASFTTPYINNKSAPEGEVEPITGPFDEPAMPEDVSDIVVDSQLPWEQGLVRGASQVLLFVGGWGHADVCWAEKQFHRGRGSPSFPPPATAAA